MVIENLSDTDYSAWQLSFDGNATIDSLWNGKLIENNNGSFKVKNAEHNPVIYADDSTSFNFDGLSDYDEVYKYNTDPTKNDTDEDKVTDGDEVILGLDPNNPATFGYPDSEYTTEQTVEVDSSALQGINNLEDNPFTISVDITAAGVADNCLTADESGYSYPILQNDAVLGVVPELSYSDGLTVSDVIINFNIVDSAVSDRIGAYFDDPNFDGINRFNIFKYFEEDNILLPVETFYDETENRVYTHVDRVGTYCLIDMEKWVNNLENTEPGNYYIKGEDANEPANIVFCIDTRSIIDDEAFEEVKSSIKEIAEDAFDRYVDIKVYIYYQKFGSNFKVTNNLLTDSNTGENYFTDFDSAEKALNGLEKYLIKSNFWAYDYTAATQYMLDTCDENIIAMYHIVSDQRVMGSADKTKKLLNALENDERVYVSTICPFSDKAIDDLSYAVAFAEKTNGIVYTQADFRSFNTPEENELIMPLNDSANYTTALSNTNYALSANKNLKSFDEDKHLEYLIYMRRNIVEILGNGIEKSNYTIISSTGLTKIKLDTVLRPKIYYEMDNVKPTDTDKDGLSDWDEVNTALIRRILTHRDGAPNSASLMLIKNEDLPTYEEICQNYNGLFYVSGGLEKLLAYIVNSTGGNPYTRLNSLKVLPICSDPTKADSDGDFMLDCLDNEIDKTNYWDIKDPNPLYAYADTKNNYGVNAAGIYVSKTKKSPEEYLVKKSVKLPYFIHQTGTPFDDREVSELTGPSKIYTAFPYELQEYMQSCCDTVINEAKKEDVENWRIQFIEKYLTPELIMAVGTTESGWTYGAEGVAGISTSYTGIVGFKELKGHVGAFGAEPKEILYANIYCSVSATACILADKMLYIGSGKKGHPQKKYTYGDELSEQQCIYDIFYSYGVGSVKDYYAPEARISSAFKLYAYVEFCKLNREVWPGWNKESMSNYCNNVVSFSWEYNNDDPFYSDIRLPKDAKEVFEIVGEN